MQGNTERNCVLNNKNFRYAEGRSEIIADTSGSFRLIFFLNILRMACVIVLLYRAHKLFCENFVSSLCKCKNFVNFLVLGSNIIYCKVYFNECLGCS